MFKKKCEHNWTEVRRYSQEPGSFNISKISGRADYVASVIEDNMFGWTMIELKCTRCGDVSSRKIRYTGR